MRSMWVVSAVACAGLMVVLGVLTAEEAPAQPAEEPKAAAATMPEEAADQIVIDEEVLVVLMDEPEHHFERARESFLMKDLEAAAESVRKGAAFLRLQAARAAGETRQALLKAARELEELADGVEKGSVGSVEKLREVFSRALQVMAAHHQRKASESWAKKAAKHTGQDLKAAALHLENAFKWSGRKAGAGTKTAINGARVVSRKLIRGVGWTVKEAGGAIKSMGGGVQEFGKKVEPKKSQDQ